MCEQFTTSAVAQVSQVQYSN